MDHIYQSGLSLPLLNTLWRRYMDRQMEVELRGAGSRPGSAEKPTFIVEVDAPASIFCFADLVLTNHRTNRIERIVKVRLHLKRRHWFFWETTICDAPVLDYRSTGSPHQELSDIVLEPMSAPKLITIWVSGPIPSEALPRLPRHMKLVLVFTLVGPIKRAEHKIEDIHHDPRTLRSGKEGSQP